MSDNKSIKSIKSIKSNKSQVNNKPFYENDMNQTNSTEDTSQSEIVINDNQIDKTTSNKTSTSINTD